MPPWPELDEKRSNLHNFMRGLRTSRLRWPSAVVARGGLVPDRRDVCHRMGSSRGLSTTGSARQCCSWGALLTIHSTAALLTTSFSRNHCTRQAQTCRHERDRVPGCWAAFRRFSTDGTPPVAKCSGVPPLYHPPSDRGCPSVRRGGGTSPCQASHCRPHPLRRPSWTARHMDRRRKTSQHNMVRHRASNALGGPQAIPFLSCGETWGAPLSGSNT